MASEIKVDTIFNAGGDNDTGIDLATNDQILLKVANATKLTMNSTGQTTIVGEGGTTTTSLQQGLAKAWAIYTSASSFSTQNSFNTSSLTDRGTGDGRINFTNAFQDQHVCQSGVSGSRHTGNGDANSGYINVVTLDASHNFEDTSRTTGVAHGDLA
jgi:hypothetical protein